MPKTFNLNCSGLVCPIPVAKTKKQLNRMNCGDILVVTGDFCEAGKNIKRYAENHGSKVLDFQSEGENYCLKIEKLE